MQDQPRRVPKLMMLMSCSTGVEIDLYRPFLDELLSHLIVSTSLLAYVRFAFVRTFCACLTSFGTSGFVYSCCLIVSFGWILELVSISVCQLVF